MKKFGILFILALFAFACNSENKAKEDTTTQELNIANLVEVTIPVHGMTCEGCENAVKKSIESLEGIAEVKASHVDSVAVVKYDKTLANLETIEEKIADAGYTVSR